MNTKSFTLPNYIHDPLAIEQASFKQIRQATDLSRFANNSTEQQIALRFVHTSGNPQIIEHLQFTPNAATAGVTAIGQGAPILCDVEMLRHGLSRRLLQTDPLCFLNHPDVVEQAKLHQQTRSMTALQHWQPYLAGAIVAIGNAPTALFRYLELLQQGAPKPALVIGMPVGFIGAAESKQALMDFANQFDISAITLHGRVGGSALAATTINALAYQAQSIDV